MLGEFLTRSYRNSNVRTFFLLLICFPKFLYSKNREYTSLAAQPTCGVIFRVEKCMLFSVFSVSQELILFPFSWLLYTVLEDL